MGIDPSSAATGIVVLSETPVQSPVCLLEEEIVDKNLNGVRKQRAICTRIMTAIKVWKPDKIVIEGYSLNMKHSSSVIPLVELGGLLRFMLHIDGIPWFDPRASEVKKFATGKGNAPKEVVMMHVLKRWGHESKSNDTADAYTCAAMGLAQANRLPGIPLELRAVAGKMALCKA